MRILVNDFSGHPFQAQLARQLARNGHDVLHVHFSEFQTPKGNLTLNDGDPQSLAFEQVTLGEPFAKQSLVKRRRQEIWYAKKLVSLAEVFLAEVVIGCNNPLDAQKVLVDHCNRFKIPFVFWLQDIYSVAMKGILSKRVPAVGSLLGDYYQMLERRMLKRSDWIVPISDDFVDTIKDWGIDRSKIEIVPNWAPLDEIPMKNQSNPWSRKFGLDGKKVALYSGTLGFKHNPRLLLECAEQLRNRGDFHVVVVSEGPGADYLDAGKVARRLRNLLVLPFQPMDEYPDVLGAASVLVSVLEASAGVYSVPSKVLSYLCSGRPLVLSVPSDNLAARIVRQSGAGLVVDPDNSFGFVDAVLHLLTDDVSAAKAGRAARAYAEAQFDIVRIAARFESVLQNAVYGRAEGAAGSSCGRMGGVL